MRSRFDNTGSHSGAVDLAVAGGSEYRIRTSATDGLVGAIQRAWRAPGQCPRTFVAAARDGRTDCTIEASTAEHSGGPVLRAVTVRTRIPLQRGERSLAICRQAFAQFGANRYLSLAASRGAASGLDITVCFPDLVPWLAENTLSLPSLVALDDVPRYRELLAMLAVRHRCEGRELSVKRHQFRMRPSRDMLLEAFVRAVEHGFRATLYAAALPVTRSVRIEQALDWVDVAISRGLSRRPCSQGDLNEIDCFCREWLGVGRSALEWRVRAAGVASGGKKPKQKPERAPASRPALRVIDGGLTAGA